jgi:Cupredoxin-like domain
VRRLIEIAALLLLAFSVSALAAGAQFTITLKGHQFVPKELEVPAHKRLELMVRNEDPTPAEFESGALHREQLVVGGGTIKVLIGPLDPGRYEFFDDFHSATKGALIAK